MRVLSIGGTRPQFVKMAVIVRAFEAYNANHFGSVEHRLLHTGQHYDPMMSEVFFKELNLPKPQTLLGVHSGSPGMQTAAMLAGVEADLMQWTPDVVVIYGDTNSTLAAAIATVKIHIPLVHLEAGLRSHDRCMQEEINRIVSDHISDVLLVPTRRAMCELQLEGLADRAVFVGDVMLDAVEHFANLDGPSSTLEQLQLSTGEYSLVTLHRAETTDVVSRLGDVLQALEEIRFPIILPIHPRLKHLLGNDGLALLRNIPHMNLIDPVGYLEMLRLEKNARFILTDSGGVQKEAYFLGVPCLTMRNETEWVETLHGDWNVLVGTRASTILSAVKKTLTRRNHMQEERRFSSFGDGDAGRRSVEQIVNVVRKT